MVTWTKCALKVAAVAAVAWSAWAFWLDEVDWNKPFAAGLLGAVLGSLAGGVATGTVALAIGPWMERRRRREERSEAALEYVVQVVESLTPLFNTYANVFMQRDDDWRQELRDIALEMWRLTIPLETRVGRTGDAGAPSVRLPRFSDQRSSEQPRSRQ